MINVKDMNRIKSDWLLFVIMAPFLPFAITGAGFGYIIGKVVRGIEEWMDNGC